MALPVPEPKYRTYYLFIKVGNMIKIVDLPPQVDVEKWKQMHCQCIALQQSQGSVQKTQSRKMSVMGVPPPSRKAAGQKVNGKKITEKGGSPPRSRKAAWNFFAENGVFCPITDIFRDWGF